MKELRRGDESPSRAGLVAGSIAAITDALVSLPLRSPHDLIFNSATVVLGALLAGVTVGVIWRILANYRNRPIRFAVLWAIGFALVAVLSVAGETLLDRFVVFVLPLAAIVFVLTGLLTPLMARSSILRRWWLALAAVMFAFVVGIGLAGQGDQESGKLKLPPRATSSDVPSVFPEESVIDRIVTLQEDTYVNRDKVGA